MDKSEPSLVPEWLRSSGSATGSGGSGHHFASSQSEGPLSVLSQRNKCSKSVAKNNNLHSSLPDWNASSNSRSSSRNGSTKHENNQYFRSYSGFSRGHRDNKRDKLSIDDHWDAEYSDPLRSILTGRMEKDLLRRSQSMVSRKPGEILQGKANLGPRGTGNSSHGNANGLVPVHSMEKMAFERDFPTLGTDERPVTPDTVRVPSPGLSRSIQSLAIGNSSLIGGEGWTSALAEVPVGPEGNTLPSTQSSTTNSLNMAEALVQAPSKSHSANQPSVQNQKREELAVLQSMRLIPLTTSMPKNVINSSDKMKPKTPRYGDQVNASKNGNLLQSLQPSSQLLRGANVKTDAAKTSHTGKLIVLKPGRDNGVSLAVKEALSPTSSSTTCNSVNGQASAGTSSASSLLTKNPKFTASTKASSASFLNSGSMADKKLSSAHAQSRSDFFKLMRKKSMSKSAVDALTSPVVSSDLEKSDDSKEESVAPASPVKNDDETICNGEGSGIGTSDNAAAIPEEEEAAFLRSLGWEESAGDDEGLTEEEINAFYQEYIKLKPASKLCRGLQLKISGQDDEPQEACSTSDFSASETSA